MCGRCRRSSRPRVLTLLKWKPVRLSLSFSFSSVNILSISLLIFFFRSQYICFYEYPHSVVSAYVSVTLYLPVRVSVHAAVRRAPAVSAEHSEQGAAGGEAEGLHPLRLQRLYHDRLPGGRHLHLCGYRSIYLFFFFCYYFFK